MIKYLLAGIGLSLALLVGVTPTLAAQFSQIPQNDGLAIPREAQPGQGYQFLYSTDKEQEQASQGTAQDVIIYWTNWAVGFIAVVALIYIIYAAWQSLSAMGDADKTKTSGKIIWQVVVGAMIIFGAYAIINTVIKDLIK
ncbi:MAG: hypothetical protein NTZ80_02360 [Patescibacteria group bacterium]|nr:hypothetical protein [Patescibacteria group bacterium]